MASAAVHSKVVVMVFFVQCLLLPPLFVAVLVLDPYFVLQYFVSFLVLVLQSSRWGRES